MINGRAEVHCNGTVVLSGYRRKSCGVGLLRHRSARAGAALHPGKQRDLEAAAAHGIAAIHLAEGLSSTLNVDRIRDLAGQMKPHTKLSTVGEFLKRAQGVRDGVTGGSFTTTRLRCGGAPNLGERARCRSSRHRRAGHRARRGDRPGAGRRDELTKRYARRAA